MNTTTEIKAEVERVFGVAEVETDGGTVKVLAAGWPDRAAYQAGPLMAVLSRFADGYGTDEGGDAEVCRVLEKAGAFLGFANGGAE